MDLFNFFALIGFFCLFISIPLQVRIVILLFDILKSKIQSLKDYFNE